MTRRWFSAKETGVIFDIAPKTLLSLASRHRLPPGSVLRLGRQVRFDVKKIEDAGENKK